MRDDDFLVDVFFALARPPRAPAVRTDIVPRPVAVRDVLFVRDLRADARPPAAPAFRFCAVEPARPPFAPAFLTVIVRVFVVRPDVVFLRAAVFRVVVLRAAVFRVDVFRAVVFFAVERLAVERAVVDVLRDDVPPLLDEVPPLREVLLLLEDDEEDFVSPDFARCLLTVRAAISLARFVERPCCFSESLMCSY